MTTPRQAKTPVHEIACQQVLTRDSCVYSVQWLSFPESCAQQLTPPLLLDRYLKLVKDWTCSVIRPVVGPEGVHFRLFSSPISMLSFAPASHLFAEQREEVRLAINGGLLLQAGEGDRGRFSFFTERSEGSLRVAVQISDYRPLLLGNGTPSRLRRLCYRFTQSHIHKAMTVSFLSSLYRELTGERIRPLVRKVRVREGQEI